MLTDSENLLVLAALKKDEGFSGKPYKCPAGATTIGYGRNLDANPLTREEGEALLKSDVTELSKKLENILFDGVYIFDFLSSERYEVILNMAYNLGIGGLIKFKKMLAALKDCDYELAAVEMLDSKWAKQVGSRATRLAEQMKTGKRKETK